MLLDSFIFFENVVVYVENLFFVEYRYVWLWIILKKFKNVW